MFTDFYLPNYVNTCSVSMNCREGVNILRIATGFNNMMSYNYRVGRI